MHSSPTVTARKIIRFTTVVTLFFMAVVLLNLGLDHMDPERGHGLSPWVAFPWAFINMVGIYYLTKPAPNWTKK
jgi:hypothetical protein